jgi:hypothetical protein
MQDGGLIKWKARGSFVNIPGRIGIGSSEPLDYQPMMRIRSARL